MSIISPAPEAGHDTSSAPGLTAENVDQTFSVKGKEITALKDVTLTVAKGEFVSLIGPSGCGKSTLLRIFADLQKPTSGVASVAGRTPEQARLDREIGMVFQSPNLLPWRSVLRNVTLPLEVNKVPKTERMSRAHEMLQMVGLDTFEQHLPRQLSGGMQQRAAIARALSVHPDVLLMDEPFGALDEITRDRLNLELLSIWERVRPTVLFVTHSIAEAVLLSTKVVVMAARPGRITRVLDIDLPGPRTAETRKEAAFSDYVVQIRELLASGGEGPAE